MLSPFIVQVPLAFLLGCWVVRTAASPVQLCEHGCHRFWPAVACVASACSSVWWQALSSQCRSSLEREDLATVAILRNALDGSYHVVLSLLMKCGGLAEDVPFLRDIWKSLESSARSELRRLGNTPTAEATAAAIIPGRKRQVPVPSRPMTLPQARNQWRHHLARLGPSA